MQTTKKILAINGSYREGGITDQTLEEFVLLNERYNAEVEVVYLRDYPIEFCRNCRDCCQMPGENPGKCVLEDGMASLVEKLELADGYILASPTNFYTVTALYKRFLERLIPYGYWPWDMNAPENRKKKSTGKKAVLVSSCAAPGFMGKVVYGTRRQLKLTAKTIGAEVVGTIFTGLISKQANASLPDKSRKKVAKLMTALLD